MTEPSFSDSNPFLQFLGTDENDETTNQGKPSQTSSPGEAPTTDGDSNQNSISVNKPQLPPRSNLDARPAIPPPLAPRPDFLSPNAGMTYLRPTTPPPGQYSRPTTPPPGHYSRPTTPPPGMLQSQEHDLEASDSAPPPSYAEAMAEQDAPHTFSAPFAATGGDQDTDSGLVQRPPMPLPLQARPNEHRSRVYPGHSGVTYGNASRNSGPGLPPRNY
ncbi:unnamed protein product [Kuraishia capsulata CBS 1993]|uniref:Uncharacterized protein n=1 Tax=Kuraishia capsulata CBS 1993 TaxID=1382522 RepID=W6MSW2_9ASCO|nr:uncharacterized protein KUCA_T00004294001 [Kuraishia capsulata CBS 1993]CDK28312.1 unnamed protein product [Kuraishia capsulata CBS 1993]